MQDEPTPTELIKAVADFLRNEITPVIKGHNAFKLRVGINALDLVTRQLTLEQGSDAAEAARLKQLLGSDGSLIDLNRALSEKIAKARSICRRRGSRSIFGRPRWTSSPSISRTTGRISGSWEQVERIVIRHSGMVREHQIRNLAIPVVRSLSHQPRP